MNDVYGYVEFRGVPDADIRRVAEAILGDRGFVSPHTNSSGMTYFTAGPINEDFQCIHLFRGGDFSVTVLGEYDRQCMVAYIWAAMMIFKVDEVEAYDLFMMQIV